MRYRAQIIPVINGYWQEQMAFWAYTNATSVPQAGRFLRLRYPYMKYIVREPVPDPVKANKSPEEKLLEAMFGEIPSKLLEPKCIKCGEEADLLLNEQPYCKQCASSRYAAGK